MDALNDLFGGVATMPRWRACWLLRAALRVSSLKTERIRGGICRTRDDARADVFDYIERFNDPDMILDQAGQWNANRIAA